MKQEAAWKSQLRSITGNATEICCKKPRKNAQPLMKQSEKDAEERSPAQNHEISWNVFETLKATP